MRVFIITVIFMLPLAAGVGIWKEVSGFIAVILGGVMFFHFMTLVQIMNFKGTVEKLGYAHIKQTLKYIFVTTTILIVFWFVYK